MKCCICEEEIIPLMKDGKVVWDQGNNAEPVVEGGRCCDTCNWVKVIPARLRRARGYIDRGFYTKESSEG